MSRDSALQDISNSSPARSSQAAATLVIDALAEASDASSSVLPLGVSIARDHKSVILQFGADRALSSRSIPVSDIRALCQDRSILAEALLHVASSMFGIDASDRDVQPRRPLESVSLITEMQTDSVTNPIVADVARHIHDSVGLRLFGQSASGKTTAAAQLVTSLASDGWTISWLDLSDPARDAGDLLLDLIRTPRGGSDRHLVVVDDAQANPKASTDVGRLLRQLPLESGRRVNCIVLAWDSAKPLVEKAFPNYRSIVCDSHRVLSAIVSSAAGSDTADLMVDLIRDASGGDLVVSHIMADFLRDQNRLPAIRELAEAAAKKHLGTRELTDAVASILYRVASLAQYEIDSATSAFSSSAESQSVQSLVTARILRRNGEFLSVGHRSIARLLLMYLQQAYPNVAHSHPVPSQIAVEYLRGSESRQLLNTLDRLDIAALRHGSSQQHGTAFLAEAWVSLRQLMDQVAQQAHKDPTWGDNAASAAMAAEVLAEFRHEGWEPIAAFLRRRWRVSGTVLVPQPAHPSKERIDFDEIVKCMHDEDARDPNRWSGDLSAVSIDLDRMHRNWLLGVLLGFEGTSRNSETSVRDALIALASDEQLSTGAFYPQRVPWVTCRIVMGLCAAGESARTNSCVRRACDWLRQSRDEGGAFEAGTWHPGTGRWVSTLQATTMAVNALVRSGISSTTAHIREGTEYILAKRNDWLDPRKEIDAAFALETVLLVRRQWRDYRDELSHLLAWAKSGESWTTATHSSDETQEESLKVAFVTTSLIRIVWSIVRSELPLLLEDLATTSYAPVEAIAHDGTEIVAVSVALDELGDLIRKNIIQRNELLRKCGDAATVRTITYEQDRWRSLATEQQMLIRELGRIDRLATDAERLEATARLKASVRALGREVVGDNWTALGEQ